MFCSVFMFVALLVLSCESKHARPAIVPLAPRRAQQQLLAQAIFKVVRPQCGTSIVDSLILRPFFFFVCVCVLLWAFVGCLCAFVISYQGKPLLKWTSHDVPHQTC